VVPAPAVTPNEPAVVYHESTVSRDPDSVVTYRTYRDPIVTHYDRRPSLTAISRQRSPTSTRANDTLSAAGPRSGGTAGTLR